MRPVRIPGYTRIMGADQPEYLPVCIRDEPYQLETPKGTVTVNCMLADFEPTPQQIQQLVDGGKLRVRILGTSWPPIAFWTEPHGE